MRAARSSIESLVARLVAEMKISIRPVGRGGAGNSMATMLDGRIYRMSLIIPALALLVLAFSISAQPGGLHSALSPFAFDGAAVNSTMRDLALRYPDRTPGSHSDRRVAGTVSRALAKDGFTVSADQFAART